MPSSLKFSSGRRPLGSRSGEEGVGDNVEGSVRMEEVKPDKGREESDGKGRKEKIACACMDRKEPSA
jgi:hypothetical protein